MQALTNEALFSLAPSIFSVRASERTSSNFKFIPTSKVIDSFRSQGLFPVSASQSRSRLPDRRPFVRHNIRFIHRRFFDLHTPGVSKFFPRGDEPVIPQVVLSNAHDGSSAYLLEPGVFRLACSNGLLVKESGEGWSFRVRHSGRSVIEEARDATQAILQRVDDVSRRISQMSQLTLSRDQQLALAQRGLRIRWGEPDPENGIHVPTLVNPAQLLLPRRSADMDPRQAREAYARGMGHWEAVARPDLWTTFNVIQENLLRGGLSSRAPASGRRVRTRAIVSVSEDLRVNRELWAAAVEVLD